ncbi:MAG TPA: hypothetical protein VLV86_13125, partial [Vicinamibacterales bacterium]|nr:hypothetical protein [Vicinamibacterales bacterium]
MSSTIRRAKAAVAAGCLLLSMSAAGCAATAALHRGKDAEFAQDYDRAVVEYTKAVRLKPNSEGAREGLKRAKARAFEAHLEQARRLAALLKLDEAVIEYGIAAELSPASSVVQDELQATKNKLRARVTAPREGKTELQALIERTRNLPPPGLDLPNAKMPA